MLLLKVSSSSSARPKAFAFLQKLRTGAGTLFGLPLRLAAWIVEANWRPGAGRQRERQKLMMQLMPVCCCQGAYLDALPAPFGAWCGVEVSVKCIDCGGCVNRGLWVRNMAA